MKVNFWQILGIALVVLGGIFYYHRTHKPPTATPASTTQPSSP